MENLSVATMPIKPRKNPCIGMCIAPIVKEVLASEMNANGVFALNTLHSYENVNDLLGGSLEYFSQKHIDLTNLFIDANHKDELIAIIERLFYDGILVIKDCRKFRCECGKVDIDENGVRSYDDGDLYSHKGGDLFCRHCNSKCKVVTEKSLFLRLNENVQDDMDLFPFYLNKEIKYLSQNLKGQDILISKSRDTGAKLTLGGYTFNIDVDFLWMNMFGCLEEKNQVFIASNHQLYEMYIMNYLSKMIGEKSLSFIATPYLDSYPNFNPELEFAKMDDEFLIKLAILYTLKWKKKNCAWDPSIIKGLANLKPEERGQIWEILSNYRIAGSILEDPIPLSEGMSLMEEINQMLGYKINMGRNIKTLRRPGF